MTAKHMIGMVLGAIGMTFIGLAFWNRVAVRVPAVKSAIGL